MLIDALPGDVGRHEVGCELHPREPEVEGGGQGTGNKGLGHSGNAFEQDVAGHQQGRDQAAHDGVLADDDLGHLVADGHDSLARAYRTGSARSRRRLGHGRSGRPWVNLSWSFH